MGRSFQSPQDRSGDQEESGRSCQSNKENKQEMVSCCDDTLGLNFQDMKIYAKDIIIIN